MTVLISGSMRYQLCNRTTGQVYRKDASLPILGRDVSLNGARMPGW